MLLTALLWIAMTPYAASNVPKVRALPNDTAATRALVAHARKVEACRTETLDYAECDKQPPRKKGVLFESASSGTYAITARTKRGGRFRLARDANGELAATCRPAGRGACSRSGTWTPSPEPVMTPAFGHEWLEHERQVVALLEKVVAAVDRCRAARGTFDGCTSAQEVKTAVRRVRKLTLQEAGVQPGPGAFHAYAHTANGSQFSQTWLLDGGVERSCHKSLPNLASPCEDGRW